MQHVEGNETRFSVEECHHKGVGVGEFAIRYTPPAIITEGKGKSIGLSFQCLIAGDILSDQEAMLTEVAKVLNASDVGRKELPENETA